MPPISLFFPRKPAGKNFRSLRFPLENTGFSRFAEVFPPFSSLGALAAFLPVVESPFVLPPFGLALRHENLDNRKKQEWHLKTVDEADEGRAARRTF